jgi:hypothetical protein
VGTAGGGLTAPISCVRSHQVFAKEASIRGDRPAAFFTGKPTHRPRGDLKGKTVITVLPEKIYHNGPYVEFLNLAPASPSGSAQQINDPTLRQMVRAVVDMASANPLVLFLHTPYGFNQIINWLDQAVLITSPAYERYGELRAYGT